MDRIRRIIFEIVFVVIAFTAFTFCHSKITKQPPEALVEPTPYTVPALSQKEVENYLRTWKLKVPGMRERRVSLLYDPVKKEYKAFDLTLEGWLPKYGINDRNIEYISQALMRDSLMASSNNLELRIRQLENTVSLLAAKCCPEVAVLK